MTTYFDNGGFFDGVGELGRAVGRDLQDLAQAEVAGYDPLPFLDVAVIDTSNLLASGDFGELFTPLLPPDPSPDEVAAYFAANSPGTLQAYGIAVEDYFTPSPGPVFLAGVPDPSLAYVVGLESYLTLSPGPVFLAPADTTLVYGLAVDGYFAPPSDPVFLAAVPDGSQPYGLTVDGYFNPTPEAIRVTATHTGAASVSDVFQVPVNSSSGAGLAYIGRLEKGILRLSGGVSALTAVQEADYAARIDAASLSRDVIKMQFINDVGSRTTAALVCYDWNYGSTPGSDGLDYLTKYTQSLPAQGFSDLNVWVNLAATAATQEPTTVTRSYHGIGNDAFIDAAYKDIFGTMPSTQAHNVFLSSMNFYTKYMAQTPGLTAAELAAGTRGCVVGVMLHEAVLTVPGTSYGTAVSSFYNAVANGAEVYGTSLRGG